jgi:hypothetical protein
LPQRRPRWGFKTACCGEAGDPCKERTKNKFRKTSAI